MLADRSYKSAYSGAFRKDVHLPTHALHGLLDFIGQQLPHWRDDGERPQVDAETDLTAQLCACLNDAARGAPGWDVFQFRTEVPDEHRKGRKIDLVASPCGATIWIDGRSHCKYATLLPIECKRLPTPPGKKRDAREYVFSQHSSTGGIQRFKAGDHGAIHSLGAMIGYVQDGTFADWDRQVRAWITALTASGEPGWSQGDLLTLQQGDAGDGVATYTSSHYRGGGLGAITLRHIWVRMH